MGVVTTPPAPVHLKDLDREGLRALLAGWGEPAYRGDQVFRAPWRRGGTDPLAWTDLPLALRQRLARETVVEELEPSAQSVAGDGTTKLLVGLPGGTPGEAGRDVECVIIPDQDRRTLCVSTQVGCAMGCTFCRTATMGLVRHLRPWEIVEQVLVAERVLEARGEGRTLQLRGRGQAGKQKRRLTNLVFMGMGEPLHNLEGTATACRILCDEQGLGFPPRRITVSTVGLADKIAPFLERTGVNLAISLNAPDDATRDALMPVNKRFPIEELLRVVRELPLGNRRRVTFEYVLLKGVTDEVAHARAIGARLAGVAEKIKVNLIPWNPHEGASFARPEEARVEAFRSALRASGVESIHVRRPRGDRILAACGQLALEKGQGRGRPLQTVASGG